MRTRTIHFILATLLSLGLAQPTVSEDYEVTDYLPLAVGNSWTYTHRFHDYHRLYGDNEQWPTFVEQRGHFTIEVLGEEVIDGKMYFVFSDMPDNWPPVPSYFIAGKKLRWEGTSLMVRTSEGEQALYRFDGENKTEYDVSTDEGYDRVMVSLVPPHYSFEITGPREDGGPFDGGGIAFVPGYGLHICLRKIFERDAPTFINKITSLRAVLGGRSVEYGDALNLTSASSSTWGQVKLLWLAYASGGRTGR